jgi:hypothetical protein
MSYAIGLLFALASAWFAGQMIGANRRAWWVMIFVAPAFASICLTASGDIPGHDYRALDSFELGAPTALCAVLLWIHRPRIHAVLGAAVGATLLALTTAAALDGLGLTRLLTGGNFMVGFAQAQILVTSSPDYVATPTMVPGMLLALAALCTLARQRAVTELAQAGRLGLCLLLAAHLTRDVSWSRAYGIYLY